MHTDLNDATLHPPVQQIGDHWPTKTRTYFTEKQMRGNLHILFKYAASKRNIMQNILSQSFSFVWCIWARYEAKFFGIYWRRLSGNLFLYVSEAHISRICRIQYIPQEEWTVHLLTMSMNCIKKILEMTVVMLFLFSLQSSLRLFQHKSWVSCFSSRHLFIFSYLIRWISKGMLLYANINKLIQIKSFFLQFIAIDVNLIAFFFQNYSKYNRKTEKCTFWNSFLESTQCVLNAL